tara:strand:+ start:1277 stop:1939 length:663 start_codon:yes stop_codon:yes gene_type:complete
MKLKAVLFGSIGTVVETSNIQRKCFNQAFKINGLDWYWTKKMYQKMLKKTGGEKRVRKFSLERKILINAKNIRNLKTKLFNNYLKKNKLKPRSGVIRLIKYCKYKKIKVAFVTSTTKNNVDAVFISLNNYIKKSDFDYIGHNKIIKNFKNKSDIYKNCLKKLNLLPKDCIAIEDTEISLKYALKANLRCVAFPGDFHQTGKYINSLAKVKSLQPKEIISL